MPKKGQGAMPPGGNPTTGAPADKQSSQPMTGKSPFPPGGNNDNPTKKGADN